MSAVISPETVTEWKWRKRRERQSHAPTAPSIQPFDRWLYDTSPDWPWDSPHLAAIRTQLARIDAGEINRLIITMPPRHMKTEHTTVRYTAWRMQRDPTTNVIIGAYNQNIANRFSRKIRRIVRGQMELSSERHAQSEWEMPEGGGLRAAGVGSGVTGMGGNLIVVDDPVKNRAEADSPTYRQGVWEWYVDDLFSRRQGQWAIIVIATRWHQDDLIGRILASDDGPNWTVLHMPAIYEHPSPYGTEPDWRDTGEALWPAAFPVEELERTRLLGDEGERGWHALYQGEPTPAGGQTFDRAWWDGRNRYDASADATVSDSVLRVIDWDTAESIAASAAWSACTVSELHPQGDGTYRLRVREVWRARLTYPQLVEAVYATATRWNTDGRLYQVAMELASSGRQLYQTLQAEGRLAADGVGVQAVKPVGSKELRAASASQWCALGRVELPDDAPWLAPFEAELFAFPQSMFRDQVDSFSQQVNRWSSWIAPKV